MVCVLSLKSSKPPNITIFSGISGIDKSKFINNFIAKAKCKNKILNLDFEKELITGGKSTAESYADISSFLDIPSSRLKVDSIESTFQSIKKKIDCRGKEITDVFIKIHLSYFKNSEFFPPFIPLYFNQLKTTIPDARIRVINLIDDVFSIWQMIKKKEKIYQNTSLRLREILAWRSLESLRAEALTRYLNSLEEGSSKTSNYTVSIRHPYSTFHNLIFQENPVRLYLSYPISDTRRTEEGIRDINEFRKKMYTIGEKEGAVIFDPVAIDELAMETALVHSTGKTDEVIITKAHRWPIAMSNLLVNFDWPIKIPKQQIEEVKKDVRNQIKSRDYTLVDSSQYLAVYRPVYKGNESKGVDAEIKHAKEYGRGVIVYHPKEDNKGKSETTHPFLSNVDLYDNEKKFFEHLQTMIKERTEKDK